MNKFDAFQKALFCTMLSSTTPVQQAGQIAAGQYYQNLITFEILMCFKRSKLVYFYIW